MTFQAFTVRIPELELSMPLATIERARDDPTMLTISIPIELITAVYQPQQKLLLKMEDMKVGLYSNLTFPGNASNVTFTAHPVAIHNLNETASTEPLSDAENGWKGDDETEGPASPSIL